ncbi:MAG: hypothetical protein ACYS8Z_13535 [Planctomycetota bacterium]|jgi:hypothetical protein
MRKILDILIELLAGVIVLRDLAGNEGFLQIALVEISPCGRALTGNTPCTLGRTADTKERFVTSPAAASVSEGEVSSTWKAEALDFDAIVRKLKGKRKIAGKVLFLSTNCSIYSLNLMIRSQDL